MSIIPYEKHEYFKLMVSFRKKKKISETGDLPKGVVVGNVFRNYMLAR